MSEFGNPASLPPEKIYNLKVTRWKARTDLGFLCREILNYKDVHDIYHAPVLNILQKFQKPTSEDFNRLRPVEGKGYDILQTNGQWKYKPIFPMEKLPGKRRRLIIDSRGCLKTTINAVAHTIQWIINYPDCAINIIQSTGDKADAIIGEIKQHFIGNPSFRSAFPELCPKNKLGEFGTKAAFITPGRNPEVTRKEPTVMAGSIDKGSAGYHYDVMKFSDIVEMNNSRTEDQLLGVVNSYFMMENLLVSPSYWIDVEGTRYAFGDLYGKLIKQWEKDRADKREPPWAVVTRGIFAKDTGDQPPEYTPDELKLPDKLDENGLPISVWPGRFIVKDLLREEEMSPLIFSAQKRNYPRSSADGSAPFPVDENYPTFIPREKFSKNVPIAYREISVDTAETANNRSNYSSICVAAWSGNGKCYIDEIIHGKFLPDKLIKLIISTYLRYNKPMCPVANLKIEETGFVRGLSATFGRYQDLNNMSLPIEYIKRDNNISKKERIINTLQPWYRSRDLVFLDDISCKDHMLMEFEQYPLSESDDILDSIADVFQGRNWFGRETTRDNEARKGIDTRAHEVQQTFARLQDYHFKQFTNQGGMEWTTPGDTLDSVNPDNYRY
jgi:hypothetical protein